jgi:hypothetical protein
MIRPGRLGRNDDIGASPGRIMLLKVCTASRNVSVFGSPLSVIPIANVTTGLTRLPARNALAIVPAQSAG